MTKSIQCLGFGQDLTRDIYLISVIGALYNDNNIGHILFNLSHALNYGEIDKLYERAETVTAAEALRRHFPRQPEIVTAITSQARRCDNDPLSTPLIPLNDIHAEQINRLLIQHEPVKTHHLPAYPDSQHGQTFLFIQAEPGGGAMRVSVMACYYDGKAYGSDSLGGSYRIDSYAIRQPAVTTNLASDKG